MTVSVGYGELRQPEPGHPSLFCHSLGKGFFWVGQAWGQSWLRPEGFCSTESPSWAQITQATTERSGKVVLADAEMPAQSLLDEDGDRKEGVPAWAGSPRAGLLSTQQRQKVVSFSSVVVLSIGLVQEIDWLLHSAVWSDLIDKWGNENNYFLIHLSIHHQL